MARHDHEKEVGKLLAKTEEHFAEQSFFAVVRAAADDHRRTDRRACLPEQRGNIECSFVSRFCGIKLHAASHADGFRAET